MNLEEIDQLIATTRTKLAPLEVPREERESTIQTLEVGTYPGDDPSLYLKSGRTEFEKLKAERTPLVEKVHRARAEEQALREKESVWGQIKQFGKDLITPDAVVRPSAPVTKPAPGSVQSSGGTLQKRLRTVLNPDDEAIFQDWYRDLAGKSGLHPDPDEPQHKYDMRGFWRSGQEPQLDPATKQPHFASEFKDDDHPNRFVIENGKILDSKQGRLIEPNTFNRLATPEQKATVEKAMRQAGILEEGPDLLTPDTVVRPAPELFAPGITKRLETATPETRPLDRYPSLEKPQPLSLGGAFTEAGKSFLRGIGQTSGLTLKGIGLFGQEIERAFDIQKPIDDYATYQLGKRLGEWTQQTFPGRPDLQSNFLLTTVFEGAGSSVPFLAMGAAGAAAGIGAGTTAAVTGGLAGAAGMVEAAPPGASDATKRLGLLLGTALGTTEALPIADLFRRMNTATGGTLARALKIGTTQAIEEAVQEGLQQLGENAVVKYLYGVVTQPLQQGVIEGAGAGGLIGLLTGFMLSGRIRMPAAPPMRQPEERLGQVPTPEQAVLPPAPPTKPSGPMAQSPFAEPPKPKIKPRLDVPGMLDTRLGETLTVTPPDQRPPFLLKQPREVTPEAVSEPVQVPPSIPPGAPEIVVPGPIVEAERADNVSVLPQQPVFEPGVTEQPVQEQPPVEEPVLQIPEVVVRPEPDVAEAAIIDDLINDVHARADELGIEWDNSPKFMSFTKQITGKEHLDDLDPYQLRDVLDALEEYKPFTLAQKKPAKPAATPETVMPQTQTSLPNERRAIEHGIRNYGRPWSGHSIAEDRLDKPAGDLGFGVETTKTWRELANAGVISLRELSQAEKKAGRLVQDRKLYRAEAPSQPVKTQEVKPPVTPTDVAAHAAATSPTNALTEPTEGQRDAGNYQKGHVTIAGLDISIENPQGSTRSGVDKSGKPWSQVMRDHYGYIRGTKGKDKDHLDVFIKPGTPEDYNGTVFVVDQIDPTTKRFDEHKVILGASTTREARALYEQNYAKGWRGLGSMSLFTMDQFKTWMKNPEATKQPSVAYTPPKPAVTPEAIEAVPGYTSRGAQLLQQATKGKEPIIGRPAETPEKITGKEHLAILVSPTGEESYVAYGPDTKDRSKAMRFVSKEVAEGAARNRFGIGEQGFWDSERRHFKLAREKYKNWTYRVEPAADKAEKPKGETPDKIDYTVQSLRPGATPETLTLPAKVPEKPTAAPIRKNISKLIADVNHRAGAGFDPTVEGRAESEALLKRAEAVDQGPDDITAEQRQALRQNIKQLRRRLDEEKPPTKFTITETEITPTQAGLVGKQVNKETVTPEAVVEKTEPLYSVYAFDKSKSPQRYFIGNYAGQDAAAEKIEERKKIDKKIGANVFYASYGPDDIPKSFKQEQDARTDITPTRGVASAKKEPTIESAPTPEEVANDRPRQATDPVGALAQGTPEGVPPEAVSAPPASGATQRPRPKDRRPGGARTERPTESGPPIRPSLREDQEPDLPQPGTAVTHPTVSESSGRDYIITPEDRLEEGGPKAKFKKNVAAIRLLKKLDREGRHATADEQAVLVKYTGWGGIKNAFTQDENWVDEVKTLRELLTPEEYETARRSIQYAHYTDPKTIDAIWKALQHMGLTKGSILEPGMGTGNFFGATPKALVKALSRSGVEMDAISGRIAQQLYQRANIEIRPFQETTFPDNHFDVAIGNVPFSEIKIADTHDPVLNKLSLSLHNYFFAKALRKVRPGGIVAFITSTGTMDNKNGKARDYLASQADLIAAYRLPGGTFKRIANTEVVTDIVILKKRREGEAPAGASWKGLDEYSRNTGTFRINEYFVAHPTHILGEMRSEGTMYRAESMTVVNDPEKAHAQLEALIEDLPTDVLTHTPKATAKVLADALDAPFDMKPGSFTVQDGKIFTKIKDRLVPYDPRNQTMKARIVGMVQVRDALKKVFTTQLRGDTDEAVARAQKELSRRYDAFVKTHGLINSRANRLAYDQDPDYPVLQSLEKHYDPEKNTAQKADIFTKRTIDHEKKIEKADSPQSALAIVLNESNLVDFDRMYALTGMSIPELQTALRGMIFQDPATASWETAHRYLSGNVREKLAVAKEAAKTNPEFAHNVDALTKIQPKDLLPSQIDARLGAGWIPPSDVEAFVRSLLNSRYGGSVRYSKPLGLWQVEGFSSYGVEATQTYGTQRMSAPRLIEMGLNSQVPTVYDTTSDNKRVVNEQDTLAAREKLASIKDAFAKWVWQDQDRATRLATFYNQNYNHTVSGKFDGSHLVIPGKNPAITLRPSQLNGIYRALQRSNTLFAHEVGTGKTYTMAAVAMESRRMGLAKKPMIVVPNHLVAQWNHEFLKLFPGANVLMTTKRDFEKQNRLKLMGKIATGDWDAVIVPFTSFTRLPISRDTFVEFMHQQIAILEDYIREEKAAGQSGGRGGNRITKDLETAKERFENKIKARLAAKESDNAVNFEETGVDLLLVDEADLFKNLYFPTRMTRVSGLPNTESQRAFDMYMKTRYLTKLNNGRGVIFATGTPISNTMAEVFTMQRYLQQPVLEDAGIAHFDAWARMFGESVTSIEMTASGKYAQKTRFANFINVPELMQMFHQVMDVVSAEEAKVDRPPLKTGKPMNVTAIPGPALKAYVESLNERVDDLKNKDPREDNMLKITGDGRHAALDVRLRMPGAPEDKDSKINKLVKNVAEIYHRTAPFKGTQLIFLDLSTPKAKARKTQEDEQTDEMPDEEKEIWTETSSEVLEREGVYGMIRQKLTALGVKGHEIAYAHDAKTDKEKDALFASVNDGKIRVLLGSTEKMGAGTNVQKRLVASHDADCPWRPRDLEQRHGRIYRFGNQLYTFSKILEKREAGTPLTGDEEAIYNELKPHAAALKDFHIEVYQYATEAPSFDVYMWQAVESKAKVIAQIMKGDPNMRTIQDVDATTMSASEMKALASGNPMVLEKVGVDADVRKYSILKSAYADSQYTMKNQVAFYQGQIVWRQSEKARALADIEFLKKHPADTFSMRVGTQTYEEKEPAGEALIKAMQAMTGGDFEEMGRYRGLTLKGKKLELRTDVGIGKDIEIVTTFEYRVTASREGGLTYEASGKTATGLIRSLDYAIGKAEDIPAESDAAIKRQNEEIAKLEEELAKPFEFEARLTKLLDRQNEIVKALMPAKEDPAKAADVSVSEEDVPYEGEEPAEIDEDESAAGGVTLRGGFAMFDPELWKSKTPKFTKEAKRYKALRAKEDLIGFSSADDEIEARVRAAKRGLQPEGLWDRLKAHSETVWHLVSREFAHLPDTPQFSVLRNDLLRLAKYKGIAADQVQRDLAAIIKPLSRKQYDQFEWKALLSDLAREADADRALPFGYTKEKVQEDLDRINAIVERDPLVTKAWETRQALWTAKKAAYQAAMDAIGFDTSKKLTKEDYFRHQILEHARARHLSGTGSKLRTPTGRGFLQTRHGSTMDINANYVQAEFEVMAQMVYDTQLAKIIKHVDEHYNIRRSLEREAGARNAELVQAMIEEGEIAGAIIQETLKDFRKRIGMHMGMARKALDLDKHERISLEELAEIADDPDSPAHLSARGVFKAISERKQYISDLLGNKKVTWQSLIPDTHALWQPREGNVFYLADSIPAQMAKALQEGFLTEAGLTADKLRKVLAMGNPREQYVIPVEAQATLDELSKKAPNWFVDMNRSLVSHWKQLMLIAPRKVLRYNVRNLTGDADAMFVGNPRSFLKLKQAAKDLIPVIFKDTKLSGEAKEWADRGGYGTTLQWQELGDINDLKAFQKTLDRQSTGGWLSLPASTWNAYWKTARLATDYRESLMRYATYLDYLEQMQQHPKGRPKNFGASIPETVMALPDLRDRAFKLSNELLGAYDRVSVTGQTLRSFWIPFWSWQEVNATRYQRLVRNVLAGDRVGGTVRGTLVGTKQAASFLIKLSMFWSMLQAWNLLMYGDDEEELRVTNPTVANRPHILFGRGEDGKIRYLAGIGALGDLLAWFGLDAAPGLIGDVMHDRLTIGEALKQTVKAPVNKLWQGLSPTVKLPLELAVRESTYPDVFHPRPIQDRADYLAQQFTVGPEVGALRGKPGKPLYGGEDVTGLLVQRTDPNAAAYGTWQGIERKYLERMGKEAPAVFWRSPRGEALSNWSRAIRDEDTKAELFWKGEYERMEREKYGPRFSERRMWQDLERSLRAKAPLAGVTKAERDSIVKSLDARERQTLEKAEHYYTETLLQILPEVRRRPFTSKLQRQRWLSRPSESFAPHEVVP